MLAAVMAGRAVMDCEADARLRDPTYSTYPTYTTYPTYPTYPAYPTYPTYLTYPTYWTYWTCLTVGYLIPSCSRYDLYFVGS